VDVRLPRVAEPVVVIVTVSEDPSGLSRATLMIWPGAPAASAAGAGVTADKANVVVVADVVTVNDVEVSDVEAV